MKITKPEKQSKIMNSNEPQPITPQSRMQKCQQLAKLIENKIQQQITNGDIKIRKSPLHIQLEQQKYKPSENPQGEIRDKISSLNMDLQQLHKQIALQKQQEKFKQERKRKEAMLMIQRLKRQKQEHHNKLRLNQMSQRLKYSAFSDDVIKIMKERREGLIQEKKRDIQLRIYKNLNRKSEREEGQAENQVSYWSKVKQFQQNKRHQSTKVLPSIFKVQNDQYNNNKPEFGVNLDNYEKKPQSMVNSILKHKKSFSKQDLTSNYKDAVHKFLERAKAKQKQSKSQKSPSHDQKSFIVVNQPKSQRYGLNYFSEKPPYPVNKEKADVIEIANYYNPNKRKILGNQYLKESLIRVKQDLLKSSRKKTIQDQNSIIQQSLQLKGNQAHLQKNDKISILEERRQRILQNLITNKISKALAIQMLGPVENKLDRVNPEGIQHRLKRKIQVFEQVFKKQQQKLEKPQEETEQAINNQFQQSIEPEI